MGITYVYDSGLLLLDSSGAPIAVDVVSIRPHVGQLEMSHDIAPDTYLDALDTNTGILALGTGITMIYMATN